MVRMTAQIVFGAGFMLVATVSGASAADMCKAGPKSGWMKPDVVRQKVAALGYKDFSLAVEDGCYEAKTVDEDRNRIEVYLHPTTGQVVKIKKED